MKLITGDGVRPADAAQDPGPPGGQLRRRAERDVGCVDDGGGAVAAHQLHHPRAGQEQGRALAGRGRDLRQDQR